jgi:hypothetical protein
VLMPVRSTRGGGDCVSSLLVFKGWLASSTNKSVKVRGRERGQLCQWTFPALHFNSTAGGVWLSVICNNMSGSGDPPRGSTNSQCRLQKGTVK